MRIFILVAALALSACGQTSPPASATACALEATQHVTWSNPDAPDTIIARAEGPCAEAMVTLSISNAEGAPLWTLVSHYETLTTGGSPAGTTPVAPEEVQRFLESWADVTETRTGALPEWREGLSRPGEGVEFLGYETPLEREVYERMRAQNLPTLCFAAAVAGVQCVFIDPATQVATLITAYGI